MKSKMKRSLLLTLFTVLTTPLFSQTTAKAPEIKLAPGTAVTTDGKIEDAEWKGADSRPLKNGGTAFFRFDGEYLYIGVRGTGKGWSHLYFSQGDDVRVFHASAALGMTTYRPDKDRKWQSSNPFSWELRDRVFAPELQKKMDDYLAKNFWVANNSNTGNGNEIEFKVKPVGDKPVRVAVVFAVGETGRYYFPETLSDDTINDTLVRGNTPADLKFDPVNWATVTLEKKKPK